MLDPTTYTNAVVATLIAACVMLCVLGLVFCIVTTIDEIRERRYQRRRRCSLRRTLRGRTWA